jgi:hypothetical protein
MAYWQLVADMTYPNRWILSPLVDDGGEPVDERVFTKGKRAPVHAGLKLSKANSGRALDFTHGPMDLPIVRREVGQLIETLEPTAVQRIPVDVVGESSPFEILNVTSTKECIDRTQSEIRLWTADDGFPVLTGKYKAVDPLRVDPKLVRGSEIFRVAGWTVALIVSEKLRQALLEAETSGIRFQRV